MAKGKSSTTSTRPNTKAGRVTLQQALSNSVALRNAGRLQEAIAEIEPFLHSVDPQSRLLAMQEIAHTYWRLGKGWSALALDLLRKATEEAVAYPDILVTVLLARSVLALTIGDLQQAAQAIQLGKEFAEKIPDAPVATWMGRFLYKEGQILEEQERYEEAAAAYQRAVEWHQQNVGPYNERDQQSMLFVCYLGCGTCYMRAGALASAGRCFEQAKALPLKELNLISLETRCLEWAVRAGKEIDVEAMNTLRAKSAELALSALSQLLLDEGFAMVFMLLGRQAEASALLSPHEQSAAAVGAVGTVRRIRRILNADAFVIREAIAQGRLLFHYMPILDLHSNQVSQHELLLRMVTEEGEVLAPHQFLHVVERSGLMQEVDRWVVRRAIRLLRDEQVAGRDTRLEVNLSAQALEDSELLSVIKHELMTAGINPNALVMEITESIASCDIDRAMSFIKALKAMGCQFAIDDFGVGSSSLSRLKHMPVDYLKIDGSFIRNLAHDQVDQHLVKIVVQLAKALGVATVAEFVEDEQTLVLLREYGVDYAQGYYVGHPGPLKGNQSKAQ